MPNRRCVLRTGGSLIILVGLLLMGCQLSDRPEVQLPESVKPMNLESAAFSQDGMIPSKYTCDGQDLSPPLSWGTPPDGTESLALIADDPDAPSGTFVHWVLYNMPPDVQQLPEGATDSIGSMGGVQGKSDFGKQGYGGPCPPGGTHRYFFKLYALDTMLDLEPGATKADVVKAMDSYIVANGELMARYSRQ
ncbi:MAG TPA: YbhB/YbcL family Raf kinase inhibitor-like protein [Elainellaceae cyanobacterium]